MKEAIIGLSGVSFNKKDASYHQFMPQKLGNRCMKTESHFYQVNVFDGYLSTSCWHIEHFP